MNTTAIHSAKIGSQAMARLATELPAIIAAELDIPGGNLARVKPEQVSLHFTPAGPLDVGSDLRLMVFARHNDPRRGNGTAGEILAKVKALPGMEGCTVDVRVYLMEVGTAESK